MRSGRSHVTAVCDQLSRSVAIARLAGGIFPDATD